MPCSLCISSAFQPDHHLALNLLSVLPMHFRFNLLQFQVSVTQILQRLCNGDHHFKSRFNIRYFHFKRISKSAHYRAMSQNKLTEVKQTYLLCHKSTRYILLQFRRHCDNPAQGDNTQKNPWPHLCPWRREFYIKWTDFPLAFKLSWNDAPPPQLPSLSNKR